MTIPKPPDLDTWLAEPAVRITHQRASNASPEHLWQAARAVHLNETYVVGRLIRWRIPGVAASTTFEQLFRCPPFAVLEEGQCALVSGLVGRIWTLRRDYPVLEDVREFTEWSKSGTAKVVFAHWVEDDGSDGSALRSEARVKAFGAQGRIGLASIRPLIRTFQHLVGSDALVAAVRRAERASA